MRFIFVVVATRRAGYRGGVSFGVSRPFFLSTGNLAHLGDAVASLQWHHAGG